MDKKKLFSLMSFLGMAIGAIGTMLSEWAKDREIDQIIDEKIEERLAEKTNEEEEESEES